MKYLTFILLVYMANQATAFSIEEAPSIEPLTPYEPLQVTGDAIAWEIFATTKEIEKCTIDEEGFDICDVTPKYSKDILAFNMQEVTLMGFMFPLDETEKQANFLIGPYPPSCPFEYHSPLSQIVEVNTKTPIKFSFDPITIKGILEVSYNEETGSFYHLKSQ